MSRSSSALKFGCGALTAVVLAVVVGLGVLAWIGDTRTNQQAAAEMERDLRRMGVGPWIDSGTLTVFRAPFGSFASDRRYARLDLASPDSDALLAAIQNSGWTLNARKPTTLPRDYGLNERGFIEYEFFAPQRNDMWWFYASRTRKVVYLNNYGG